MSKIYFNTNLEFLRKRKGWTQLQLADKLGVTDTVIAHWEHGRRQPLPKNVYNGLKIMLKKALEFKYFKYDMFVFGMIQPFKETNIQKHKNKYCDLANLKRIRTHDFRHSCASLLISKGASIALVSKYLGHGSIKMTLDTYTHLYKNELVTISNQLDNLI